MDKKRKRRHSKKSKCNIFKKFFLILIVIIVVMVIAIIGVVHFIIPIFVIPEKKEPEVINKSTLEKIINVSDLSTFEAVYNGIAKVMNENEPDKVDYYVSYEATVKAGINFKNVKIIEDRKSVV